MSPTVSHELAKVHEQHILCFADSQDEYHQGEQVSEFAISGKVRCVTSCVSKGIVDRVWVGSSNTEVPIFAGGVPVRYCSANSICYINCYLYIYNIIYTCIYILFI